jgi:hypothetical protein
MTDVPKTPEQLAANRLAEAIVKYVNECSGVEIAVAAFATANRSEGSLQGLIRLLVHKGVLTRSELGDSIAWALDHRTAELQVNAEKGSIVLATAAPHARGSN